MRGGGGVNSFLDRKEKTNQRESKWMDSKIAMTRAKRRFSIGPLLDDNWILSKPKALLLFEEKKVCWKVEKRVKSPMTPNNRRDDMQIRRSSWEKRTTKICFYDCLVVGASHKYSTNQQVNIAFALDRCRVYKIFTEASSSNPRRIRWVNRRATIVICIPIDLAWLNAYFI